jgi:hypothetical protein
MSGCGRHAAIGPGHAEVTVAEDDVLGRGLQHAGGDAPAVGGQKSRTLAQLVRCNQAAARQSTKGELTGDLSVPTLALAVPFPLTSNRGHHAGAGWCPVGRRSADRLRNERVLCSEIALG